MVAISQVVLTIALAGPLAVHGLVFKAVSECYPTIPPWGTGKRDVAEHEKYEVDWTTLEKRQTTYCTDPYLVGFADDGSQLTFNGGVMQPGLSQDAGNCFSTNGDYANGAAFGVDSSPGHYSGGLINFQACAGLGKGVSYNGCYARLDGQEGGGSKKTNCNGCKANGFTDYCECCAVFF